MYNIFFYTPPLKMLFKNYFIYGSLHFLLLAFSTFKESSHVSFYSLLVTTTRVNYVHLLHVSFLVFLLYSVTGFILYSVLGPLRSQEVSVLNDNLFLFLTDILLVLSVFSRDMNFRNGLVFFLVLCMKSVVWMMTTRIEHQPSLGVLYLSYGVLVVSTILTILSLYISFVRVSVIFLFAFEFAFIALASTNNILSMNCIDD